MCITNMQNFKVIGEDKLGKPTFIFTLATSEKGAASLALRFSDITIVKSVELTGK